MASSHFRSRMPHHVAVELDAHAGGAGSDLDDRGEQYLPVAGLEAVNCRVSIHHPKDEEVGDRRSTGMEWHVWFPDPIVLDTRHRLVYVDPQTAALRYGYVVGHTVNHHGLNHHWTAIAQERPI